LLFKKAEMKQLVNKPRSIIFLNRKKRRKLLKIIITYSTKKVEIEKTIIHQIEVNIKEETLTEKFKITQTTNGIY
jgi:hypothetical protein